MHVRMTKGGSRIPIKQLDETMKKLRPNSAPTPDCNLMEELIKMLMSRNIRNRELALTQIELLAEKEEISRLQLLFLLRSALTDPQWLIREKAMELVGLYAGKSDLHLIRIGLRDPVWNVRYTAVDSARLMKAEGLTKMLCQMAMNDPNPLVRGVCALSLAAINRDEIAGFLLEMKEKEKAPVALIRVLLSLAMIGKPRGTEEIEALFDTDNSPLMCAVPMIVDELEELNVYDEKVMLNFRKSAENAEKEWRRKKFGNEERQ